MRWLYFRWAVSRLEGKQGVHIRSTFASSPVPIICVFISISLSSDTDGGRIALAMFGRKGTYLVNTFTTIIICGAGILHLDESRILLMYVLFTLLWQRELESPARNEVEELDFPRGVLGIATSLLVALVLVPML
jgi:hypothetical protein